MRRDWIRVKRQSPCRICGKPDFCCVSLSGWALCTRIAGGIHKIGSFGDYWLYPPDAARSVEPPELPTTSSASLAVPTVLDEVYQALLSACRLNSEHRRQLRARGLSDEAIRVNGYGSLPGRGRAEIALRLNERFGDDKLARVPGFYVKEEEDRRWWSIAGLSGMLIPTRDVEGRIVALMVRTDAGTVTADGQEAPRYLYLTSSTKGGPSPGSPVHVPLSHGDTERVRVTEGHLKADVATHLSGLLTISVPGVSQWGRAVPVLRALKTRTAILAFDQDARTKANVARALHHAAAELQKEGF